MIIEELNYQLDDIALKALACGNKAHRPVLCLHGYLDNAASFLPLMQQIVKEANQQSISSTQEQAQTNHLVNRRVIALEWPGHGHSDHRSDGTHYHFFDYVSDLVNLFRHNNWPAIDIVAHSMGGMIASAFAAAFPEKVKSLTLIDSFGFICGSAEQATNQLRQGILSRTKKVIHTRSFSEETAIKARLLVSDLQNNHAMLIVQRSLINVESETPNHEGDVKSTDLFHWRSDPRLRTISPYRLSVEQAKQLLSDIKCPVQLVYGDKGMDMVIKGLSLFSDCVRDFISIKISGGHHVHMEQTEQLCNILKNFYQTNKN
jgi:pimeloyl-ACP methyl ester carboxylesterase